MNEQITDIGPWSEVKLEIVRKYAQVYNTILSKRFSQWPRIYVDAFAGAGVHISRVTGDYVLGSPLNALLVRPPFTEYHFIDIKGDKIESLKREVADRSDVYTYAEDANEVLINEVFPKIRYEEFRRGLCLLDPYGLHLEWNVIAKAGAMKSIEIFLNFPIMDINMNVLKHDHTAVDSKQAARLTRYWGDESWREIAYDSSGDLFGYESKVRNETVAMAFRERLKSVAGFKYVPDPIPMKNSSGSTIYFLYFASQQPVADQIVKEIFDLYR